MCMLLHTIRNNKNKSVGIYKNEQKLPDIKKELVHHRRRQHSCIQTTLETVSHTTLPGRTNCGSSYNIAKKASATTYKSSCLFWIHLWMLLLSLPLNCSSFPHLCLKHSVVVRRAKKLWRRKKKQQKKKRKQENIMWKINN